MPVLAIFYRNGEAVKVDWSNLDHVIAFAHRLGGGLSVIEVPERGNFNIIHTSREGEHPTAVVWYRTDESPM